MKNVDNTRWVMEISSGNRQSFVTTIDNYWKAVARLHFENITDNQHLKWILFWCKAYSILDWLILWEIRQSTVDNDFVDIYFRTKLTCISRSAVAACSRWREKALGFLFTTISAVLFLHAVFFVPHVQLLEHFSEAFLHGQPGVLAVFLRLHEFLQEQVYERTKYMIL